MVAGKPIRRPEGWRAGKEWGCSCNLQATCWEHRIPHSSSSGEVNLSEAFNWLDEAHWHHGGSSTDLNVNLILKTTFTKTYRIMFDQISRYHDIITVTGNTIHHNRVLHSSEQKWTIGACNRLHGCGGNSAEWKKYHLNGHRGCDSIFITCTQ